jgi:hypothetical protein
MAEELFAATAGDPGVWGRPGAMALNVRKLLLRTSEGLMEHYCRMSRQVID